MSKLISLCF